jgi:alkanesulfonate monooxygenase SsuD/methylene tetrahydromethanopterin reductase-like flavin-dependent oxidoreductase (luciferase family)
MQFWSGTPFMATSEALAIARMLDEAGYDGVICADHLIYPRNLTSPYPSRSGSRRGRRRRPGRIRGS